MNKVGKKIVFVIKTIMVIIFLLVAFAICLQRFTKNSLSLFNYRIFGVVTSSMVPKYQVGDVLLCKNVDIDTLIVGDDISYEGKQGNFNGKIITHRIINIMHDSDGNKLFQTKGIATTTPDPVIEGTQVYGKIVRKLTILSILYKIISTPAGFYIAIFIPLAILIGSEIVSTMIDNYKKRKINKAV